MSLKSLDSQFVFVSVCMSGLFCIANLLEEGRKIVFCFVDFNSCQTKMKENISIINVKTKSYHRKDIEACKKMRSKEKIGLKFAI